MKKIIAVCSIVLLMLCCSCQLSQKEREITANSQSSPTQTQSEFTPEPAKTKDDLLAEAEPLDYEKIINIEDEILSNVTLAEEKYNGKVVTFCGAVSEVGYSKLTCMYPTPNGTPLIQNMPGTFACAEIRLPHDNLSNISIGSTISVVGTFELSQNIGMTNFYINDAYIIDDSQNKLNQHRF